MKKQNKLNEWTNEWLFTVSATIEYEGYKWESCAQVLYIGGQKNCALGYKLISLQHPKEFTQFKEADCVKSMQKLLKKWRNWVQ